MIAPYGGTLVDLIDDDPELKRYAGTLRSMQLSDRAVCDLELLGEARRMTGGGDRFVEVFVDTPLEVCESRDTKGMYAQARAGTLRGFTGIDDPYEEPLAPEVTLDTVHATAEENARRIVALLVERGFVQQDQRDDRSSRPTVSHTSAAS